MDKDITHGMSGTKPYIAWKNMLARTRNPSSTYWENYGGRGITVDGSWHKFENFWRDMGPSYEDHLTLDRVDNNGDYCKSNCKWSTVVEQSRNRRSNVLINTPWGKMTLTEACEKAGLNYGTVNTRHKSGVPEENLLDPVGSVRYNKKI